jgi:hypothetical protein
LNNFEKQQLKSHEISEGFQFYGSLAAIQEKEFYSKKRQLKLVKTSLFGLEYPVESHVPIIMQ